jgi:NAD+ diphosphatase
MKSNLTTTSFRRLVAALKDANKTCTTIEQSCGGMISSGIMAQPGASKVFVGGTVAYDTKKSKPLLLNDDNLYETIFNIPFEVAGESSETEAYIESKLRLTALTSVAYCKEMKTDYAIAEGGATGPTFRPNDMTTGFAVVSIAGRDPSDGSVSVIKQKLIRSNHANRQLNMKLFADAAADLATAVIEQSKADGSYKEDDFHPSKNIHLDRSTHLRSNKDTLELLRKEAKYVVLRGNKILVKDNIKLALLDQEQLRQEMGNDCQHQTTFLGIIKGSGNDTPVFGIDIVVSNKDITSHDPLFAYVDTRTTAPLFDVLDNELALHATAVAEWQRRTSFCNLCGGKMDFLDGGTRGCCTQCNTSSWPRQDPSMISLISSRCQQKVLLARSKRHPPMVHTVLAGFIEAGETFEAAVAREAHEEAGVKVDDGSVQYLGSQPWPFPQSCMIGFTATADDSIPLNIDPNEIESAAWFDKAEVLKASKVTGSTMQVKVAVAAIERDPSLKLLIPPKGVIARKLIDHWLEST